MRTDRDLFDMGSMSNLFGKEFLNKLVKVANDEAELDRRRDRGIGAGHQSRFTSHPPYKRFKSSGFSFTGPRSRPITDNNHAQRQRSVACNPFYDDSSFVLAQYYR